MENKVLIKLVMFDKDECFDIFIPVNEIIWKIKKLIIKSISDIKNQNINPNDEYLLINKDTAKIYDNNEIVINTDIRNGTELIMFKK